MVADRGKRKAGDIESPASKASKRRAEPTPERRGYDSGASEGEEDTGRMESQDMIGIIKAFKLRDDGWIKKATTEIDEHEQALNDLLDAKARKLADVDDQFHDEMRSLLTDVLGGPAVRSKPKDAQANSRPGYDHAQLLFAKSQHLLNCYTAAADAIEQNDLATDQLQRFEKDKSDVAQLLHIGQEVARRQIQKVLKWPDDDVPRKKPTPVYSDERLEETATIFATLREGNNEQEQNEDEGVPQKAGLSEGPGLYPLIHDAKKGVKKIAGNLVFEASDWESSD